MNTVTANCIIILLASMHALRVKNQIKPFQQKSTKVYVPFTEHPLLCWCMLISLIWLSPRNSYFQRHYCPCRQQWRNWRGGQGCASPPSGKLNIKNWPPS